ncbi:MAG TPA: NfeD family protein [Candidatus Limnocylindrales bacterium]|jgi:membrane-bound serine protease (ClpP class)
MIRRVARTIYALSLALGLLGIAAGSLQAAGERQVIVLPAEGVVDNVLAGYLTEGIARAEREGAAAVIIRLNTPGGGLDATQRIVSALLEADVPTIVWVAPAGSRAASAGTFITLAAHIAVMAPGTNIGAASVVGFGENLTGDIRRKAFNDAIANIRAIAEERGRNVEWAVSAVEQAVSSPAGEAVEMHVVDGIAATLPDVVAFANGRTVTIAGADVAVATAGATVRELPMNPFQGFLHLLADPNIAALLFSLGSLGLVYELINPNFVTGILGALAVILAFIGFGSLPLNVGGLLLIGLAMLLFALEITVISHGLLAVGGVVCFALGASALYTEPGSPTGPDVSVAFPLIAAMTTTLAAFMALVLLTVVRSRRRMAALALAGYGAGGSSSLAPGTTGQVRSPLAPVGSVYAAGEEWTARSSGGPLERGTPVRVVAQEGLTLIVEPVEPAAAGA